VRNDSEKDGGLDQKRRDTMKSTNQVDPLHLFVLRFAATE
jgi:hypothetical protein